MILEITDFDVAVHVEEDIFQPEMAMSNVLLVDVLQTRDYINRDEEKYLKLL